MSINIRAPRWRFGRMRPSEINQTPVQGEFFTSATDLSHRFVRESLQNSLDARNSKSPVRVRYCFSDDQWSLPVGAGERYLNGLRPHLQPEPGAGTQERKAIADARQMMDGRMRWLTVEDFRTRGLSGDVTANDSKEAGNHFWGFFRSVGISPKTANDGGSWGLGKWVFPDASAINAYFGVTRREDDPRVLVMGMAVLNTHSIDGDKYPPYGQFAVADEEVDSDWLPLPVDSDEGPGFVEQIGRDFRLARGDCPGLSVIVPFPKSELTRESIARAVVTQYFYPVVHGDLEVEIIDPRHPTLTINAATIEGTAFGLSAEESPEEEETPASLAGVIRLSQWACRVDPAAHIAMPVPTGSNPIASESDLREMRARFERAEPMAFDFGMDVQERDGDRMPSRFRLYLQQDDDLDHGHDYFVRGHLSVSGMNHIRSYKARSLTLIDGESSLGHLLRDAEGPAHMLWNPHEQRLKTNWRGGYRRVQEVRRACTHLLQQLVQKPEERQFDALADLFPADLSATRGNKRGRRKVLPKDPDDQPPSPRTRTLSISETGTGFVVRPGGDGSVLGTAWTLRFAYDVVRGDPFSRFQTGSQAGIPDFAIGDGSVEFAISGGVAERTSDNGIRFRIDDEKFRLRVDGLDGRDVIADLRPLHSNGQTQDRSAIQ